MARGQAAVLMDVRGSFELMEFDVPEPAPGAVLVRTELSGVCGTDVHVWDGDLVRYFPRILGHEVIGRVAALGDGVTSDAIGKPLAVGDVVQVVGFVGCGQCYLCAMGDTTLCVQVQAQRPVGAPPPFPSSPYFTGGFAEYFYVKPGDKVVKLPPGVPIEAASAFSCGGPTVSHAVAHDPVRLGETVVVQGAGPVGLYGVLSSKLSGAYKVISIGAPANRLAAARLLGADETLDIEEVPDPAERLARVRDWTDGIGPDVVLDCTGFPAATAEGLEMVRRGGRFFVIGQFSERGSVPIAPDLITFGEVRVQGSRGYTPQDTYRYLRSIEIGLQRYPIEQVISHRFRLDQADEALAAVKRGEAVRAVFAP